MHRIASLGFAFSIASASVGQSIDPGTVFETARKAYSTAPGFSDVIHYTVDLPGAGTQEGTYNFALGAGKDIWIDLDIVAATGFGGDIYLTSAARPGAFFTKTIDDDFFATLTGLLPDDSPSSMPQAMFRWNAPDAMILSSFGLGLAAPTEITGAALVTDDSGRTVHEVHMQGPGSEILARFDVETGFLVGFTNEVHPQGAPEGMMVSLTVTFDPAVVDDPADAVIFDIDGLEKIETVGAMFGMTLGVGDALPSVELAGADGGVLSTDDFEDRITVLEFWSSWCALCRVTLPQVDSFADEANSENLPVDVYAVNMLEIHDDGWRARATKYWSESGVSLTPLFDFDDALAKAIGINSLPVTIVVGPDGVIRARHSKGSESLADDLARDIQAILDSQQ